MTLLPAKQDVSPPASTLPSDGSPQTEPRVPCPFFIVGIGASAGGLEALEELFHHMPVDSGMAFIVLQHLSPDHESHMDSLLSRQTAIPIRIATEGMPIEANHIYLSPPTKDLTVAEQRIRLADKMPDRGLTLPIDHFLRSLAQDAGHCAIGVILSGTGSDGSRGVRAIHDADGLVIVQSDESAKFNGMPRSAERTGCADLVLPPGAMPEALVKYARRNNTATPVVRIEPLSPQSDLERIYRLLRSGYGIDFSLYKPSTVVRRIDRRMLIKDDVNLSDYVESLESDPGELNALYRDLLIGVTHFFRDKEMFDRLAHEVIPSILSSTAADDEIRVWVPGCATGEEAYSLAILFREQMDLSHPKRTTVRIFATDVHHASLDIASAGVYSEDALADVSSLRKQRFFHKLRDKYQVSQELRQMVVFAPHNVIADAPFTRLDLISCRNLLIYFQPVAQKKVLSLFHFGLKTGGTLVLGPSETPGDLQDEFQPINKHWRIYRKRRDVRITHDVRMPNPERPPSSWPVVLKPSGGQPLNENQLLGLYERLIGKHLPPSVLTDDKGELLHVFGGAESLMRMRGGRPTTNVLDLIANEMRTALAGAIQHAVKDNKPVSYSGVQLAVDGEMRRIRLVVEPISDTLTSRTYLLVSFESQEATELLPAEDIPVEQVPRGQLERLEIELRHSRENLQATIEELETSNEELQATNEELVASNEELQSTNEELHSVNEELYTVNGEYQRKITELTELTDDVNNLLASTDVGVIFLDTDLCIRKFTPRIAAAFHLLPQDVGRPLESFAHNLDHPELLNDLQQVLATGQKVERDIRSREGAHYLLRILPYSSTNKPEGAVLTLIDIERIKQQEADLRRLSNIVESSEAAIVGIDWSGIVLHWNGGIANLLNCPASDAVGQPLAKFFGVEEQEKLRALLNGVRDGEAVRSFELAITRRGDGARRFIRWTISTVQDACGRSIGFSLVGADCTERRASEELLLESEQRMRKIVDSAMDAVVGMDDQGLITRWNPRAERIFGYTPQETLGRPLADLIIPPEFRAAHWEGLKQFLDNGRSRILNKRLELLAVRRNGQRFPIELTVAANKIGERLEFSAFLRDITARQRAERRLATEHAISQILINASDLPAAVPLILSSFCRSLEVDVCSLWLPTASGQQMECAGYHSTLPDPAGDAFRSETFAQKIARGEDLVGRAWQRREPMWNTDLPTGREIVRRAPQAMDAGLTTVYAFPLLLNREVLGVVEFFSREELPPNVPLLEMMIAIGHDLGQFVRRTRFEQELASARKAAEAANEAKSAFLANMSHEIRTPMTSVVGLTELLLSSETDAQRVEMLRMIQRSSHHLVELINDILDLSKIESGKLSVDRVHCSPVELVQDLASVMAIRAKDKGLIFEVHYGGPLPATIYTDPMRLRQILINLVGNAIKFTNEGGVRIAVRYHTSGTEPRVEFEVRDTGIGMSSEHLERLFVPFSQADHSVTRRFGGTGLGLCISQRLAHALQGEIQVESQPGAGSTFRLYVATHEGTPLIDPAQQQHTIVTDVAQPEEIKLHCRALIAEDTRGIQYLIKRFLETAGADVVLAQNGQEAVDQVLDAAQQGEPIDVILMDMHMPVLSGYDAARQLRERGIETPIVALTARAMQGDREKCLEAGCNDYLPKPVDRRQLLETVARQLERPERLDASEEE